MSLYVQLAAIVTVVPFGIKFGGTVPVDQFVAVDQSPSPVVLLNMYCPETIKPLRQKKAISKVCKILFFISVLF